MLNIYINTWGNYNENGADGGKWITLPMDEDELQELLDKVAEEMRDEDPEWFVNDYEWTIEMKPFEVHEMDNYFNLNEKLQELDELDEDEQTTLAAIIEATEYSVEQALDILQRDSYIFYRDMELKDVAYELVEGSYFTKGIPDIFTRYFDYETFARDLGFDGYIETTHGVIVID